MNHSLKKCWIFRQICDVVLPSFVLVCLEKTHWFTTDISTLHCSHSCPEPWLIWMKSVSEIIGYRLKFHGCEPQMAPWKLRFFSDKTTIFTQNHDIIWYTHCQIHFWVISHGEIWSMAIQWPWIGSGLPQESCTAHGFRPVHVSSAQLVPGCSVWQWHRYRGDRNLISEGFWSFFVEGFHPAFRWCPSSLAGF